MIPADGEIVEGIASVDESAVTGESAPVIREAGGDRSAVTGGTRVLSDWIIVRVTSNPGRDLPRPDHRPGRRSAPAEDAERDRAPDPARRRSRSSSSSSARRCCRSRSTARPRPESGQPVTRHRAGGAPGLPHSDHHRRAALRDRHRRHGPHDPRQRHRDLGQGGGGGGRRRRAAARQDRDDHARQPAGDRVRSRPPASRSASWPTRPSSPRSPTRRRKGAASSSWPRRSTACASARSRSSAPSSSPSPRRPG